MPGYSRNKDFDRYITRLIKTGKWTYIPQGRSKHAALRHENGGICPVPGTPASHQRSFPNFRSMTRRVERRSH